MRSVRQAYPRAYPSEVTTIRLKVEQAIESLITLLDALDGDENLEPFLANYSPVYGDRELDTDLFEGDDKSDDEPFLGWPEAISTRA